MPTSSWLEWQGLCSIRPFSKLPVLTMATQEDPRDGPCAPAKCREQQAADGAVSSPKTELWAQPGQLRHKPTNKSGVYLPDTRCSLSPEFVIKINQTQYLVSFYLVTESHRKLGGRGRGGLFLWKFTHPISCLSYNGRTAAGSFWALLHGAQWPVGQVVFFNAPPEATGI